MVFYQSMRLGRMFQKGGPLAEVRIPNGYERL